MNTVTSSSSGPWEVVHRCSTHCWTNFFFSRPEEDTGTRLSIDVAWQLHEAEETAKERRARCRRRRYEQAGLYARQASPLLPLIGRRAWRRRVGHLEVRARSLAMR